MKPGRRALGVAESYRGTDDGATRSTLAGAVVRADRAVDDLVVGTCTVGGTDATGAIADCWRRLDRPDVRYVLVAGVALAWYNVVDLEALHEATGRPVLAVTEAASDGLATAIADAFDGEARDERLARYEALPERRRLPVGTDGDAGDGTGDAGDGAGDGPDADPALFVRSVGIDPDRAAEVVAAYTHERRPEPLRVAGVAARRIDAFRRCEATPGDGRDRRD